MNSKYIDLFDTLKLDDYYKNILDKCVYILYIVIARRR